MRVIGTNFYVSDEPTCDNPAHTRSLHIGKSSAGWKFGFHGIPDHDPPLTSWAAWQEFLADRVIEDEYGQEYTLEEFRPRVENRHIPKGLSRPICRVTPTEEEVQLGFGGRRPVRNSEIEYHDPEGYDFYEGEFS